jgi:hypothetical protein
MHVLALLQSPWVSAESDSLVYPMFGYTLERLWRVNRRCFDGQIASRSPSLLGTQIRSVRFGQKVAIEDVQCLGHDSQDQAWQTVQCRRKCRHRSEGSDREI